MASTTSAGHQGGAAAQPGMAPRSERDQQQHEQRVGSGGQECLAGPVMRRCQNSRLSSAPPSSRADAQLGLLRSHPGQVDLRPLEPGIELERAAVRQHRRAQIRRAERGVAPVGQELGAIRPLGGERAVHRLGAGEGARARGAARLAEGGLIRTAGVGEGIALAGQRARRQAAHQPARQQRDQPAAPAPLGPPLPRPPPPCRGPPRRSSAAPPRARGRAPPARPAAARRRRPDRTRGSPARRSARRQTRSAGRQRAEERAARWRWPAPTSRPAQRPRAPAPAPARRALPGWPRRRRRGVDGAGGPA